MLSYLKTNLMNENIKDNFDDTASLDNLSRNIIMLMKQYNINESDLAKKLNVTYNTIHRIVSGTTSDPKLSTLQQIAAYFNVGLDSLLLDKQDHPIQRADSPYFVPVLTWENAQSVNFHQNFKRDTWHKWIPVATSEKEIINKDCYALESTRSMQPKFPIGTTFVIKPAEQPLDGDLVLIKFKDDQTISLRELVIDSPE